MARKAAAQAEELRPQSATSVSYTHLALGLGLVDTRLGLVDLEEIRVDGSCRDAVVDHCAVSYTHLMSPCAACH